MAFDNAAWQYDEANDIYWQVGVVYVANPASLDYETLGIYVPGAYLEATANGGRIGKNGGAYEWRIPALLHGRLRVPPLRTASVAPFGLFLTILTKRGLR